MIQYEPNTSKIRPKSLFFEFTAHSPVTWLNFRFSVKNGQNFNFSKKIFGCEIFHSYLTFLKKSIKKRTKSAGDTFFPYVPP